MAIPHSTINLPLIMSIPQAKLNSPLCGVNSTVTGSLSGSLRSMLYSLITTSLAQVSSVFRTKVTLAGTPALSLRLEGWKPSPLTSTVAVCAPFCNADLAADCLFAAQQACGGLQQFCAGLQQSCAPLQQSCAGLQHSLAGLQQSCAPLQQSCAGLNANAVRATAATSSAMAAIIVFLFKVFLLIVHVSNNAQNFTRVAAAIPSSHTATRCRVGVKDEGPQARALAMLVMEDTTANWMKLRISHPAR